jgi:hypothetical protein
MPPLMRCSTSRSRMGRPATRSIGLGRFSVSGRRRVPRPPAMITAQFGRKVAPSSSSSRCSPSRRPCASTMGICRTDRACISSSTSARLVSGPVAMKLRKTWGRRGESRAAPVSNARRMSPSVRVPTSWPSSLMARQIWAWERSSERMASSSVPSLRIWQSRNLPGEGPISRRNRSWGRRPVPSRTDARKNCITPPRRGGLRRTMTRA